MVKLKNMKFNHGLKEHGTGKIYFKESNPPCHECDGREYTVSYVSMSGRRVCEHCVELED